MRSVAIQVEPIPRRPICEQANANIEFIPYPHRWGLERAAFASCKPGGMGVRCLYLEPETRSEPGQWAQLGPWGCTVVAIDNIQDCSLAVPSDYPSLPSLFAWAGVLMLPRVNPLRRISAPSSPEEWAGSFAQVITAAWAGRRPAVLLTFSARLRQSITYSASSDAVEIGTDVAYAAIHQFGGEISQGAYGRKVLFRVIASGSQRGQVRFAKRDPRAKNRFERDVSYGARIIRMPARPFLGFDSQDGAAVQSIITKHIRAATGGAATP